MNNKLSKVHNQKAQLPDDTKRSRDGEEIMTRYNGTATETSIWLYKQCVHLVITLII